MTYCKVIEYEVSWPEDINTRKSREEINDLVEHHDRDTKDIEQCNKFRFHITPIGMKIVLFNDKIETFNNANPFYSMFDKNGLIVGTQWIPYNDRISKYYEKHGIFYQLPNSNAKEYRYETSFVKSNFFHYSNSYDGTGKRGYTVI